MYVEDVDLCIRAWEAGLRVTYCPASVLVHLENASVTDLAWRDENVVAGWERLEARWPGRWPRRRAPVRVAPRASRQPASPGRPLLSPTTSSSIPSSSPSGRARSAADEAKLVVYGPGYDAAGSRAALEAPFETAGIDTETLDALAIAAPDGSAPPPVLSQVAWPRGSPERGRRAARSSRSLALAPTSSAPRRSADPPRASRSLG